MIDKIQGWCQDCNCSLYDKELSEDGKCYGHDIRAKSIAKDIVALTERLDSQEKLKESWRVINLALNYLSSKDSMFTYEKEVKEKIGDNSDSDREL